MRGRWLWALLGLMVLTGTLAQEDLPALQRGDKAPALKLLDEKGKEFLLAERLKEEKVKGAVLVVWSMHCPVCETAMPDLEKLHQTAKKGQLLFYGINVDSAEEATPEALEKYRKEKKVSFPNLLDPKKEAAQALRVKATPTVFLIGKDGTLWGIYQGHTSEIAQALQRDVAEYVATGQVTAPPPQASFG